MPARRGGAGPLKASFSEQLVSDVLIACEVMTSKLIGDTLLLSIGWTRAGVATRSTFATKWL